jgi:excisionase family DNA binding protein
MEDQWYTVHEICTKLKLSEGTVRKMIRDDVIKSVRFLKSHRIHESELERLSNSGFLKEEVYV